MRAAPRVLLVTGAYYPEISASGIQCRSVAAALGDRVRFSVLTTAVDPALRSVEVVDGVTVYRVHVDVRSRLSKTSATVRLLGQLAGAGRSIDLFHVHGFSQKNVPVALMARLFRKPTVLTLHTAGQDEPDAIRRRGSLASWAFASADLVLPVSPYLSRRCFDAGLPPGRVRTVPNGIDTTRFQPASDSERAALRHELRWPEGQAVVLFVGFFSRDKRPDLLFRAWQTATRDGHPAALLVYVGATDQTYYEIDDSLARAIRTGAAEIGKTDRVRFVDPAVDIEKYFRAADVFVLPSARESHPVALLEAMACGLPCIATRLPGATDVIIDDGVNGRLCPADDETAFAQALGDMLTDRAGARTLGARARETVAARYDIRHTAEQWRAAYDEVLA